MRGAVSQPGNELPVWERIRAARPADANCCGTFSGMTLYFDFNLYLCAKKTTLRLLLS
jgi:hypothetical protein